MPGDHWSVGLINIYSIEKIYILTLYLSLLFFCSFPYPKGAHGGTRQVWTSICQVSGYTHSIVSSPDKSGLVCWRLLLLFVYPLVIYPKALLRSNLKSEQKNGRRRALPGDHWSVGLINIYSIEKIYTLTIFLLFVFLFISLVKGGSRGTRQVWTCMLALTLTFCLPPCSFCLPL